nr:retrovirus-related Pol polyprotein from transposon TNT 1-94 [Tanacetum cinerariifolium]
SDADYAGCKDSFKSTSGGAQFLGEKRLTNYGFHFKKIPIYCDSKSAIAISCNPVQHSRTKHIVVRYHFIKEHMEKSIIKLYFVKMDYQLADLFTKALPADRFNYLVRLLGMRNLSPQELDRLAKSQLHHGGGGHSAIHSPPRRRQRLEKPPLLLWYRLWWYSSGGWYSWWCMATVAAAMVEKSGGASRRWVVDLVDRDTGRHFWGSSEKFAGKLFRRRQSAGDGGGWPAAGRERWSCMCARYQAKPTEKLLKEVKRIFRYLRGTVNTGLECPKLSRYQNKKTFVGGSWSDSDEDEEEKTKDEKCLMAKASNETFIVKSHFKKMTQESFLSYSSLSLSLQQFGQIIRIPFDGQAVFTNKWDLGALAYSQETEGPYHTELPTPEEIH